MNHRAVFPQLPLAGGSLTSGGVRAGASGSAGEWRESAPRSEWRNAFTGVLRQAVTAIGLAGVATSPAAMAKSSAANPSAFNTVLGLSPQIASINVPRTLSITTYWPFHCGPTNATLVSADVDLTNTLVVTLDRNQDWAPDCAANVVPYTFDVSYTPTREGDLRVMVITTAGEYLGETTLVTRNAPSARSQFDVTGAWCDPATNGSGLTILHSHARGDTVFGTWFVYDVNGMPRWYSIQDVRWKEGGTEAEGTLYEAGGVAYDSLPETGGCPALSAFVNQLGRARLVFQTPHSARVYAIGFTGSVLFTSNVVRAL